MLRYFHWGGRPNPYKSGGIRGFRGKCEWDGGPTYTWYPRWPDRTGGVLRPDASARVAKHLKSGWWVEDFETAALEVGEGL